MSNKDMGLFETTKLLQNILDTISDVIVVLDKDFTVLKYNKAGLKLFKKDADNIVGKKCYELWSKDFICNNCPITEIHTTKKIYEEEKYIKSWDRWVNVRIYPILDKNGKIDKIIEHFYDITKRKKVELELTQLYLNQKNIFNVMPAIICYKDDKNNILYVNDGFIQQTGFTKEELENKSCYDLFPEYADAYYKDDMKVIKSGKPKRGIIEKYQLKNGDTRWTKTDKVPFRDENRKIIGIIVFSIDINENLNNIEKLKIRNEELEQFAYIASHDLQEPLRVVSNYCQLLQENYPSCSNTESAKYLKYILDGTERMKNLIKDLLDFSRVGKNRVKYEEINLNEILREILNDELIGEFNNYEERVKEIQVKFWGRLPVIIGERLRIKQLFYNLISNSVKFRSKERKGLVKITYKDLGNFWQFKVADNGIGIDKEYHKDIFKIFRRLYTREEYPGTGIGLALCKKIVESYKGSISVKSQKDKGSCFIFTLKKY